MKNEHLAHACFDAFALPHRTFSKATGTNPTIASPPTIQAVTERAPLPKLPSIGEPLVVDVPPAIEEVDTKTLRELVRAYNAAVGCL